MKRGLIILFFGILFFGGYVSSIPIFPGAQGFGANTRAAYGAVNDPVICVVDTIAHRSGSLSGATNGNLPNGIVTRNGVSVAAGSFYECLHYAPPANTGKVILFEVSGTIHASTSPYEYRVFYPYTTIAGQTAPSPGITLRNIELNVRTSDVLVQHVRSRVGDAVDGTLPRDRRSINVISGSGETVNNVVVDHVTATWGIDTCFTVWQSGTTSNVTISNSIVGEGLDNSLHPDGPHSKGLALQTRSTRISALYNFIVSNNDRNPYVRSGSKVLINNYEYNHRTVGLSIALVNGLLNFAAVGNVGESGPSTASGGMGPWYGSLNNDPTYSTYWDNSNLYFLDNVYDEKTQANSSDWSVLYNRYGDNVSPYKVTDAPPLWPTGLTPMPSSEVKSYVLANAGARPADRDSADSRLVNDANTGSGQIINSPSEVGGWPVLSQNTRTLTLPSNPHADDDGDGYTNLEEWIHSFSCEVEGPQSPSCISSPLVCNEGQITSPCLCGGVEYSSGYCCSGFWQSTSCPLTTVFSSVDYFGDSNNWEEANPSRWAVVNDAGDLRYGIITTDYTNLSGSRLGEYSIIKNREYDNFNFSAKAKSPEDFGLNPSADYDVIFGYQNENNYYYMMFSSRTSNTELFKVVNGVRETIETGDFAIPDNNYHNIKIGRSGSNIKVYFDNNLIIDSVDSTFSSGKVGIGSFNDAVLWDDVLIVGSSSTCGASDSNSDGIVTISELIDYISQWKIGNVSISNLIDAIGKWKSGC
jgi:hypothetical protein